MGVHRLPQNDNDRLWWLAGFRIGNDAGLFFARLSFNLLLGAALLGWIVGTVGYVLVCLRAEHGARVLLLVKP